MRRGGRLELILVLPDGSHLMVPAAWTDLQATPGVAEAGTLCSLDDLIAARRILEPVLERVVLAARDDRDSRIDRAAASGVGGEPGARGGVVGAGRRTAAADGDDAIGGVDRADGRRTSPTSRRWSVSERSKLTSSHLRRQAFVYLRQSSQTQVERNVESTARQYALVERAIELGFTREQVIVIDEDLGISGSGLSDRSGFARLAAEVALGHAGLVLGLEVSRLARNNVDWYRLLDLCGVTDTVIGDADGLYHPGSFNDRLLLGLKGTMSEAELHVLRARLEGGIRNKAQRGELRKALPIGLVWGEEEGEILIDPDEAVRGAIQTIFDRFAELGSVRQVWLWMRREGVQFPLRRWQNELRWVTPTYHQIHSVLESPVYAGAYAFGKTRRERYVDEHGNTRQRLRRLPQAEWGVLIWEHHPGFIDKATFERNRERIAGNTRPRAHEPGGAVREGSALLQGIAVCGRCGRKLKVHYQGRRGHKSPAYHCPASILVENRGEWCVRVGGGQIDQAVTGALLAALTPAGVKAALQAAEALEQDHDAALKQWRLQVERARYQADRAERRYRQVEPEHRLVARGLERDWENALGELAKAEAELALREQQRPRSSVRAGARAAVGARRRHRSRVVRAHDH